MSNIKIVGDSKGDLYIEFCGKKVAKVIDEFFWKDYINSLNEYLYKVNKPCKNKNLLKLSEYITQNIWDNISIEDLRYSIESAVGEATEDYFRSLDDTDNSDDE